MRRLSMKKIKDILRLRFITNISYRQISRAVTTCADYCKRFEIIGKNIDEFLTLDEDEIYSLLFPEKSCRMVILFQTKKLNSSTLK